MPFASKAQQRFFYANRKRLAKQGVDVEEWSKSTDYSKIPDRVKSSEFPKLAVNTMVDTTSNTERRHGTDVQQPLTRNPYMPQYPEQAADYENGYEHAMGMGHLGVQNYNLNSAKKAPVAWREGFADALQKLGRGDLADVVLGSIAPPEGDDKVAGMFKAAAMLTNEGLMSLAAEPQVFDLSHGILFDIDGTLVDDNAWTLPLGSQVLRPNVLQTLMILASHGIRMAAVTNRSVSVSDASKSIYDIAAMNLEVLEKTGGTLRDVYFMANGPTQYHKPSGYMLQFAMSREGIDPSKCIYVGNSDDDMNAAEDAGIPFVHADEFFSGSML